MPCPRCGQSPTSDPLNISCGCGVLWFDTPESNGTPEPTPQPSADMLWLLGLLDLGCTRSEAVTAFGGDREAELRVDHMWAFLQARGYVGSGITERGRELALFREVA